jgi:hypothetical protein
MELEQTYRILYKRNSENILLWTPAYTPGDGQTSWVYSTNPVLYLYISCYVTVNKPVLSYLSLCLLPTVVTPIRLYPLYCTLYPCTLTLTRRQLQALVALSFAFVSEVFILILQCALHWLQLSKRFSLTIPLRNPQILSSFFSVGSLP